MNTRFYPPLLEGEEEVILLACLLLFTSSTTAIMGYYVPREKWSRMTDLGSASQKPRKHILKRTLLLT